MLTDILIYERGKEPMWVKAEVDYNKKEAIQLFKVVMDNVTKTILYTLDMDYGIVIPQHVALQIKNYEIQEVTTVKEDVKVLNKETTVAEAMQVLSKALAKDKTPGSYYWGWQSNLACSLMDNVNMEHDFANEIAIKFLELLIKE